MVSIARCLLNLSKLFLLYVNFVESPFTQKSQGFPKQSIWNLNCKRSQNLFRGFSNPNSEFIYFFVWVFIITSISIISWQIRLQNCYFYSCNVSFWDSVRLWRNFISSSIPNLWRVGPNPKPLQLKDSGVSYLFSFLNLSFTLLKICDLSVSKSSIIT